MKTLADRGWLPDYLTVRRRHDLQPPQASDLVHPDTIVVLGTTRLIDNIEV